MNYSRKLILPTIVLANGIVLMIFPGRAQSTN